MTWRNAWLYTAVIILGTANTDEVLCEVVNAMYASVAVMSVDAVITLFAQ